MLVPQLKNNLTKTEICPYILKNNCQHTKVILIFWFLIMTFESCFYNQSWIKWACIHIGNNSGHIGQTHLRFPNGCLTLNEMLIKLSPLVFCSINDNLTNTSSAPPSKHSIYELRNDLRLWILGN